MSSKGTIAVIGATGQQGGGVVSALLKKGGFQVRAITRDPGSAKAKALLDKSPEVSVVRGDLADKASLVKAFEGVAGLFLVTDCFTAGFEFEAEFQQGKVAVDAAVEAKVPFVVWSGLEDVGPALRDLGVPECEPGHYSSHFEAKAAITEYLEKSGLRFAELLTAGFYENPVTFWVYRKQPDGSLSLSYNMEGATKYAWHAAGDIGESAAVVFASPEQYAGQRVTVASDTVSMDDAAAVLSQVSGKTVKFHQCSDEEARQLPFKGAVDIANMYTYMARTGNLLGLRPLDKRVFKGIPFAEWAQQNAERVKAKLEAA